MKQIALNSGSRGIGTRRGTNARNECAQLGEFHSAATPAVKQGKLLEDFMARNALRYLGLREDDGPDAGSPQPKRLAKYFESQGLTPPIFMRQVQLLSANPVTSFETLRSRCPS